MKRLIIIATCLFALAGCAINADTVGSSTVIFDSGISATLVTPSSPLTYGWVMAHGDGWLVQVGPKSDLAGKHVAVYASSTFILPGWTVCPPEDGCGSEIFQDYDELVPGRAYDYAIVWTPTGWQMQFGLYQQPKRVLMVINVGSPNGARYDSDTGEPTTK